jgi:hypothetical protein
LHWKPGLDFFRGFQLQLVFVSHWNNTEGGEKLDTSRCFMGRERFRRLVTLLPPGLTIVGLDEHTALYLDLQANTCTVLGNGSVTLIHTGKKHSGALSEAELQGTGLVEIARLSDGHVHIFNHGDQFEIQKLGAFQLPASKQDIPPEIWQRAIAAQKEKEISPEIPSEVQSLVKQRETARDNQNWGQADNLRDKIVESGWQVKDTPDGPVVEKI